MSKTRVGTRVVAPLLMLAVTAGWVSGQAKSPPTNDAPNPYQTIEGWAKMPTGRTWGSTSAVDIDKDGVSVWVAERCGANSCANSDLPAILKFDANGDLVKAFGAGIFDFPHGIHVDRDGNIWVTDAGSQGGGRGRGAAADAPAPPRKGHQVFKFSPEGELLLTLGKAGVTGTGNDEFNSPSDVITAANGDIFVADGHSANTNNRIMKFDKTGKFIKSFGKLGSVPGELNTPHALAMDSQGRLFVGDRANNRIQIFDQDGNFIEEWSQFSRPSGLYIDKNDILYVADSESNNRREHGEWKRGIRIGSARDGKIIAFIPDPADPNTGPSAGTSAAEGVAADANGVIYGAEVYPRALKRYVKKM